MASRTPEAARGASWSVVVDECFTLTGRGLVAIVRAESVRGVVRARDDAIVVTPDGHTRSVVILGIDSGRWLDEEGRAIAKFGLLLGDVPAGAVPPGSTIRSPGPPLP